MSELSFRICKTDDDLARLAEVFSRVYNSGNPVEVDELRKKPYACYLGTLGDDTACGFALFDFMAMVRGAVVPCGGIAAVGVLPEHRRGGVGKGLMEFAVREMASRGQPLSSLYAFREPFYRKFGYEVAGKRIKIKAPVERLRGDADALPIRKLGPTDWKEIDACYRQFANSRSGLNLRDDQLWHRVLAENRPLAIYVAGDPVEAYAVISHSNAFWSSDHVSELVWSSLRGHSSILDFVRSLGINKRSFEWYEPSDSPTIAYRMDEGITVSIERPVMWRVTDIPAALAVLQPEGSGEAVIQIRDETLSANQGPWLVSWANGVCDVAKSATSGVEIDCREFAQMYLGDPSIEDFVRWGRFDGSDPNVQALRKLLAPRPVYCLDFF